MKNRYDFIYLFDAQDANPNGDPDAGNLPRVDTETNQGLITDVCLKRKVRNFVEVVKKDDPGFDIYVKEKAVLIRAHEKAYQALRKEGEEPSETKAGKRKGSGEKVEAARQWMCQNFYDIRTFGAVMSIAVNCGQVRGPIQLGFSRSIDPIVVSEHAITRMAVATEKEAEAQQGDNRTMGRKFTVPYGLYRTHGFVNPFLADQTGFNEDDLELFFQALENAFQFDQSAARPAGSMAPRALLVFKHDSALGKAPSHTLFDRLQIEPFEKSPATDGKPPRAFTDYAARITFDGQPLDDVVKLGDAKDLGNGISLIRRI
ncbi:type I-C CRISPR-associated protein Cas7/Csd2 [Synoicihabitans lomoniglobus]|uniref:Type I-C CRISPR-associated protein Cas7/Csd2 n=1 Tax=Synoicihabitans lomoniglobus TaxID=2909285 RepID=A0AAE9ZX05_9BACT|nr:type I-C CRISPR-associated protein Cas7/Csd2 [Opitutaceae bacterium LMO-M01]WED64749.1 type I-C CRISPR-associated protein Cas7/Csd2 [Opitutaceae bacterium LMO-M01]